MIVYCSHPDPIALSFHLFIIYLYFRKLLLFITTLHCVHGARDNSAYGMQLCLFDPAGPLKYLDFLFRLVIVMEFFLMSIPNNIVM